MRLRWGARGFIQWGWQRGSQGVTCGLVILHYAFASPQAGAWKRSCGLVHKCITYRVLRAALRRKKNPRATFFLCERAQRAGSSGATGTSP